MKYLEQHGALLLKAKPKKTLDIVMDTIQKFKKEEKTSKNLYRIFDVFRNLDEVYKFEETKTLVEYFMKNLGSFEEARAEIATFIINYYVFKIKNNDSVDDNISEYFKKIDKLLDNENITRVIDQNYLLSLFTHLNMNTQKVKVLQLMGKRSEILKLHFNEKHYEQAFKYCNKHFKDHDLSILLLQLICEGQRLKEEQVAMNQFIPEILELIKSQSAYSTHFILNILKKNSYLNLKHIKKYFSSSFASKTARITTENNEYANHLAELNHKKGQLDKFKTTAIMFQPTACYSCKNKLTNPAVFFFCGHSYHYPCLENFTCPECQMEENQMIDKRHLFESEVFSENDLSSVTYKNITEFLGKTQI